MMKNVISVSMCLEKIGDTERRCGQEAYDDEIYYQVRGKFGKSTEEQDDMMPDTRWVKWSSLVDNEVNCNLLDTFAKGLQKVALAARKRLREDKED